jgi:hypothetical protein
MIYIVVTSDVRPANGVTGCCRLSVTRTIADAPPPDHHKDRTTAPAERFQ